MSGDELGKRKRDGEDECDDPSKRMHGIIDPSGNIIGGGRETQYENHSMIIL